MFVRRDLTDSVPTPEGDMHYVRQGSGFPLVMLHPLGTSTWAWHTVIDSLSQHYTCYAFDMLGHGESDKPTRHFNIPDYANALDHACQCQDDQGSGACHHRQQPYGVTVGPQRGHLGERFDALRVDSGNQQHRAAGHSRHQVSQAHQAAAR